MLAQITARSPRKGLECFARGSLLEARAAKTRHKICVFTGPFWAFKLTRCNIQRQRKISETISTFPDRLVTRS